MTQVPCTCSSRWLLLEQSRTERSAGAKQAEQNRVQHVVRQPDGEEHEALLEAHDAAEQRADDGEVVGRVGHPRQPPLPAGYVSPIRDTGTAIRVWRYGDT